MIDAGTDRESDSLLESTFNAPSSDANPPYKNKNWIKRSGPPPETVEAELVTRPVASNVGSIVSASSPGSPLMTGTADLLRRPLSHEYPQGLPGSSTPPCQQVEVNPAAEVPASDYAPDSQESELLSKTGGPTCLPELLAVPSKVEAVPAPEPYDEVVASVISPYEGHETGEKSLTNEEMDTFHRFLVKAIPTPETGFGATAPGLTCELHEMITEHVVTLVSSWFIRDGLDPERP